MSLRAVLLALCLCACNDGGGAIVTVPNPDTSLMEPQVISLIEGWRQRVEAAPEDPEKWGRYATILDAHSLSLEAEVAYRRAYELNPASFHYPYLLGLNLDMQGRTVEEKLPFFEAAEKVNGAYPPLFLRKGDLLSRDGRMEDARLAYERALELDPQYPAAHAGLGALLLGLDELEKALEHILIAKAAAPNDRPVNVSLARAYSMLGRQAEAKAITDNLAHMSIMLGDGDVARQEVRKMGISSEACFERARQNMDIRRWDEAIRELRTVVAANPKHAAGHDRLGQCFYNKGQFLEAIPHYERAIAADPAFTSSRLRLAGAQTYAGQFSQAETTLKAIIASPEVKRHMEAKLALGELYIRAQRLPDAIATFEATARTGPLPGTGELSWGRALAMANRQTEAVGHLQKYVLANPTDANGFYTLALVLEELGQRNGAIKVYETAVSLNPNHGGAARLKALRGH